MAVTFAEKESVLGWGEAVFSLQAKGFSKFLERVQIEVVGGRSRAFSCNRGGDEVRCLNLYSSLISNYSAKWDLVPFFLCILFLGKQKRRALVWARLWKLSDF